MFRITKILLGIMCVMAIGSVQAGLTKYLGVSTKSVSPKGDRVAKSYYWSGELCICDHATGKVLKTFQPNSDGWLFSSFISAREFIWSPCKNEVIVFSEGTNKGLLFGKNDYSFTIYNLDQMDHVWGEGFSVKIDSYSILNNEILVLNFADGSISHFNLRSLKWVYHSELSKQRMNDDVIKFKSVCLLGLIGASIVLEKALDRSAEIAAR